MLTKDSQHGALPAVLVLLTFVTGLVDAVSYLGLGHVFVANMTGNVLFIGFALAGAKDVSLIPSLVALGAFVIGATIGGRLGVTFADRRERLLATALTIKIGLFAIATLAAFVLAPDDVQRYVLIVVMAVALGLQNAAVRRLAVADLTTTVLTLTITGIGADSSIAGGSNKNLRRRVTAVIVMLAGALAGALLLLHTTLGVALAGALVLLIVAAAGTWRAARDH